MELSIKDLPWLPAAPADFSARCRAVVSIDDPVGSELQALAGFHTTAVQAGSLSRAVSKAVNAGRDISPLTTLRLGILSNGTHELLVDEFGAAGARHGIALTLTTTPYDQISQQALDPTSHLNVARPDMILLAIDHRWLRLDRPALAAATQVVEAALEGLESVVHSLRENSGAAIILQTVPTPPSALFGSFDRRVSGTVASMIEAANRGIICLGEKTGDYVFDVAALAARVGLDNWFDAGQWNAHKLPFASRWNAAYADGLGRLLGAIRGKARKCLVLDLDNTCWGGVIGDDGIEGIKIGQGSAVGEAFLAVQQLALDLHDRGVILAVSSKNDDLNARLPFREHPDMLLRESHISVFQANWNDKADNLEAIAKALNIGLDALVFLDDNPAERAQLRAALPQVAVPELPSDPVWYPWILSAAGYFEAVSFSAEDRLRASSYASDALRAEVLSKTRDLGEYLSSLKMTLSQKPFDAQGRQRIVQLINKSNQFNLTTRRYTEAEVAEAEEAADVFTLQTRLSDRFGDMGVIGVVVGRPAKHNGRLAWEMDTWLMSCRVLGRKVEQGMLGAVVDAAREQDVKWLIGVYKLTAKNGMVAHHYRDLGFEAISQDEADERRFILDVDAYETPTLPFV